MTETIAAPRRVPREPTRRRGYGALVGVVSASAGLAVSELASGALHQRVSPVVAVAESIIGITPGWVIEHVIDLLGHRDKPVLVTSTLVGLALVSALVGILAQRSVLAGQAVFLALGAVLVVAVHKRLTTSPVLYVPAALGVVVALAALAVLTPMAMRALSPVDPPLRDNHRPGHEPSAEVDPGELEAAGDWEATERELSRRRFLLATLAVASAAVVIGVTGRVFAHSRAAVEAARRRLRLPIRARSAPAGSDLHIDGLAPWVTDADSFYRIDTTLAVPQILPEDWELRVHGMVDRELTLSYDDLVGRGLTEAWITLCCVSNPVGGNLISNAHWSGVPIADVLAEAGVRDDADAVLSTSADGWSAGTPLAALTDGRDALFAVAMNGEPLTPEHGFPVRMVVPGLYGYVSGTKWVVDLEVSRFDSFTAFWTERGWSEKGPIKTESRIDVPRGSRLSAGEQVIAGIAWAQHTGIEKVELRIGNDDWVTCELADEPTIDSWRQWSYRWDATPGRYTITVRATDSSGYTQTSDEVDVVPDGATGWDTISVDVR